MVRDRLRDVVVDANGASIVTHWPFSYSWVGSVDAARRAGSLDAEQVVVLRGEPLSPRPDSSIACAIVTAAGTPYRCCAAIAPGAMRLMNACCACVPGAACADAAYCL